MNVTIMEAYQAWTAPRWFRSTVRALLEVVDPRLLAGLSRVVLTNSGALNRERRRSIAWVRGRKVRLAGCGGVYHRAHEGQAAWIEVFVDVTLAGWPRWLSWVGLLRDLAVGEVLYHEIGHHIHAAHRPEFREREVVAEEWRKRLQRQALQRRHAWAGLILRPLRPAFRLAASLLERQAGAHAPAGGRRA